MYWRPFQFLIFSLFAVCTATSESCAGVADRSTTDGEGVASLSGARSHEELAARIAKLLVTSKRSDLDRLVTVSDCTTSLAAGWERVRRTMPETEQEDIVGPDLLAVSRFLGLVEGRLQTPIPKTWAETLCSSAGHGQKSIAFRAPLDLVGAESMSGGWLVERDGARWLLKAERRVINLPPEVVALDPVSRGTVKFTRERAYVAVYSSLPESKYKLFAIDPGTGKVEWSSDVWGTSRVWPRGVIVAGSGHDWHVVTIRSTGGTLVLFGISRWAVYIEVFDRKTGENRCRFSTAYSHEIQLGEIQRAAKRKGN
jgi:hypothetical protein